MKDSCFEITPIGIVHSPFKQKFGIPRQAGLIQSCLATVELYPPYNTADAVKGLSKFSHIWLTFKFHQNDDSKFRPLVRPPRLGGNEKIGVFASRSSFRPNGLGMSLVKLNAIKIDAGKVQLKTACPDILDGTPIFDIKPYINYSDYAPEAISGFAPAPPETSLKIEFNHSCKKSLAEYEPQYGNTLQALITETLAYDPRPAYKPKDDKKEYAMCLYDLNITWTVSGDKGRVIKIEKMCGR